MWSTASWNQPIFVKSCLTSQVAGNIVLVLRQRDMQVFLNELMGVDDLPDPDFVFDDVAMSAVRGADEPDVPCLRLVHG